ncbi:ion transport protein [Trypanosoma grayi]|uniref:ion transport protein n=1 Tax=Trypanosoma grayi TaxID=71804 RepID=UPI0004F40C48|nr:ion transport protein [Trypanosoma grayi]KEG08732.1 ion transport protein [Trypanosoma grayi]
MELRERAERLMRPQVPTVIPPVTPSTRSLRQTERRLANHSWLRGAMCFLAVICYGLSLFDATVVTHSFILVLSLAGEAAIVGIYRIKARTHGITSKAGASPEVSVFHSPLLGKMLLEMLVWIIQCPPLPSSACNGWVAGLDGMLVLRLYVLMLYATHFSHASVFGRAIASVLRIRVGHRFLVRTTFLMEHLVATVSAIALGLVILACYYAKVEGTSFGDALYFCIGTASLVGLGDVTPTTFSGRATAVCAMLFGVAVLCWIVGCMHEALSLNGAERNLYALFRSNELCDQLPAQAARLIQRAWKLHIAKRRQHNVVSRHIAAFLLSQEALAFREMRRELSLFEEAFLRSTRTLEDYISTMPMRSSSATTPQTSSNVSPLGTPRSRRPFPLFQEMRVKAERRSPTPHSSGELQQQREVKKGADALGRGVGKSPAGLAPLMVPRSPVLPRGAASRLGQGKGAANAAELEQRLSKLKDALEVLVANAERLHGRLGSSHGVSV